MYVLIALGAAGCAQVFGIDQTSPYPDEGLRLTFERRFIGAAIVSEPMDLTAGSATFLILDDADPSGYRRVAGVLDGTTALTGDVEASADAAVQVDIPDDDVIRIFDLPGRTTISGLFAIHAHPNAEPAPTNAALDLNVTLDAPYAAGEGLSVYAVGAWSVRGYPEVPAAGATTWDPPPIMYSTFGSITGRPLERITSADQVLVLHHVGPQLRGVLEVPRFDQQDATDTVGGILTPVTLDQSFSASVGVTMPAPRFAQTRPAVANVAMSWSLNAAPGWRIAATAGPQLHAGPLTEADTTVTVMYGNPFAARDWQTTFIFSTNAYRPFTPPGLPAVNLYAGLYTVGSPATTTYDLPQGLPLIVTLAGGALTTDGMMVTLDRSRPVEISVTTDRQACDFYGYTLYELVMQGTGTAYAARGSFATDGPSIRVPGDVFAVGVPYTIRVVCQLGGFPAFDEGDFTMRDLPTSVGYLDSGVFTVMP